MRAETTKAAVMLALYAFDVIDTLSEKDEDAGTMLSEAVFDFVNALADELGTPQQVMREVMRGER